MPQGEPNVRFVVSAPRELFDLLQPFADSGVRSEFMCNAAREKLDRLSAQTTHRPSFEIGNNEFISIDSNGDYYCDGWAIMLRVIEKDLEKKFDQHAQNGSHADCVICQENARRDPRTAAELDADQQAAEERDTINSVRP